MTKLTKETLYTCMLIVLSSDEDTQEKLISRICKKTGFSREKVEHILDVTYQVLQEDMPIH